MKRMIASVLAVLPTSHPGTTNHRHNKTQIAVGKAAGFELAGYPVAPEIAKLAKKITRTNV
jgi:hypothetical protein